MKIELPAMLKTVVTLKRRSLEKVLLIAIKMYPIFDKKIRFTAKYGFILDDLGGNFLRDTII